MYDSQKLSFENFALGYKHGVYIFVQDTCDFCQAYKRSIEYINNHYLYFVEVNTVKEMEVCEKITGRSTFPITAGFVDNELEFSRVGWERDLQMAEVILPFLKQFGDAPLSPFEIEKRVKAQRSKCMLTYYVFPNGIDPNKRADWLMHRCAKFNELPIDIDTVGIQLPTEERERMLKSYYANTKLVVFKNGDTNLPLDDYQQRIVIGYAQKNKEVTFITRDIDDEQN